LVSNLADVSGIRHGPFQLAAGGRQVLGRVGRSGCIWRWACIVCWYSRCTTRGSTATCQGASSSCVQGWGGVERHRR
jgi:hypothetical protein